MERTQRIFVLLVAVFFVSAYLFDLETGLLAALGAIILATLFKATFSGLARLQGYDTGEGTRRLALFLLLGLAGTVVLGLYGHALLAGSLAAAAVTTGALVFWILRQ